MPLPEEQISKNKNSAKQCMMKADQFIKESRFAEAKAEVQKAKAFDPSNMYINAFIDRINYFEEQKKAELAKKAKESPADSPTTVQTEQSPQKQSSDSVSPVSNKEITAVNPKPSAAKPAQPTAAKPVQPPAEKTVQPPVANPAQPAAAKPTPPPAAKPVQLPAEKTVQPPVANPAQPAAAKPTPPPAAKPVQPPVAKPAQPPAARQTQPNPDVSPKQKIVPPPKIENVPPEGIRPTPAVPPQPKTEQNESTPKVTPPVPQQKTVPPPKSAAPAAQPTPSVISENDHSAAKVKIDAASGSGPTTDAGASPKIPIPMEKRPAASTNPPGAAEVKSTSASVPVESKVQKGGVLSADSLGTKTPSANIYDQSAEKQISAQQLAAMKKQIEKLSLALEQEKIAREEMHLQKVQQNIPIFRAALQNAWIDGAPSDAKKTELLDIARSAAIPEALFNSLQREVKIEMYGKAVKEVIAKRRAIRHSSSTLDWLRKVYQITMEEYVEYESKFLLDLVADQYRGVVLHISSDEESRTHITARLKSAGFAVIISRSPEDALEKIDQLNPNLILCESSFGPGSITGIKFLHILRKNSKFNFVPFILLSTVEDRVLLTAAELKPNEGFLVKPVDDDELSAMMNSKLSWFKEYVMSLSE